MKNVRMVAGLTALLALLGGLAWAEAKDEDGAQTAAESWLKLVDQGKYDDSWAQAAALFKGKVTREQWQQAAAGARSPLGKLVSRKLKSRQATGTLPGAPDGKYVMIQFDAVYEKKTAAVETVTPMLDPDGVWRVAGYFIK
jgi:hypothetical protein